MTRDMPVMTLEELLPILAEERRAGRRIVFTNGVFDILHRGHLASLEEARRHGDRLVVGMNSDESVRRLKGPSRPIHPLADRAALLAALRPVDWVVPFAEETPIRLIEAITPEVLVKGGDYSPETIVGSEWVRAHGGQVIVAKYVEGHSTTALVARMREGEPGNSP